MDSRFGVLAIGGNSLIKDKDHIALSWQYEAVKETVEYIADLIAEGLSLVITHGNGPQVGNLLLQQECCGEVPRLPLEILVAQTQGQIGYMIESTLDSELMDLGIHTQQLVSLISYVVVDEKDPAFVSPSKPIGPVYAQQHGGYPMCKTDKGYRRVVVSPEPVTIVEKREIKKLIEIGRASCRERVCHCV